jgi:hypothetical protein
MRHIAAFLSLLLPSLAGAATLSGIVTDKEGKPIEGATVTPATAAVREGTSPLCPSCYSDCAKSSTTDASGKFTIADVDDALVFNLLVASPGYRATYAKRTDPRNGDAKITLSKPEADATALRGRVLDPEGRPVFGATISPNGYTKGKVTGYGGFRGDQMAVTDREGNFEIICTDPAVDGLSVHISAPQLARRVFDPLPFGKAPHTFNLDRGVKVQGRLVRDGKGAPTANVTIVQQDRSAQTYLGTQVIGTDIDGKFELSNVPAGVLWILSANRDTLTDNGVAASLPFLSTGADTEMTLPDLAIEKGLVIEGRVRLADGNPVPPNTRILISREPDWDSQIRILDADGRFQFPARAGEKISFHTRVPNYTDTVRMEHGVPRGPELVVTPLTSSMNIVMERSEGKSGAKRTLTGVVRTPDGQPASNAKVYLLLPGGHFTVNNGILDPNLDSALTITANAEGRYSLTGGFTESLKFCTLLALHEKGWAEVPVSDTAAIDLKPWITLEGTARQGGTPLANRKVKASFPIAADRNQPKPFFQATANTDDQGHYKIERGVPGIALIGIPSDTQGPFGNYLHQVAAELVAGEINRIDIGGKGMTVAGRIDIPEEVRQRTDPAKVFGTLNRQAKPSNRPADPKAAASHSLRSLLDQEEHTFSIDADGSYAVHDVTSGTYSLGILFPEKLSTDEFARDNAGIYFALLEVSPDEKSFEIKHSEFRVLKQPLNVGDKLPDFTAQSPTGAALSAESFRGRPGVVVFASGDPEQETALVNSLSALAARPESKPFVLWVGRPPGISSTEGWDFVKSGDAKALREAFGVQFTPSYLLFSKEGNLVARERSAGDLRKALTMAAASGN